MAGNSCGSASRIVTSRAGARIDVAEFQRDHAAADEDHGARQFAFAEHLVGRDHEFGARNRQRSRLRSGRDHDMPGLEFAIADADGVGAGERAVALDDLDVALGHRAGEVGRDVLDHVLLAVDQRGPVELRLADRDVMNGRALDFVQRMAGGDQHLLRRAAAVRAGAAEQIAPRSSRPTCRRAGPGPVTPMPALPPPRMTTSNFSAAHRTNPSVGNDRGCNQAAPWRSL